MVRAESIGISTGLFDLDFSKAIDFSEITNNNAGNVNVFKTAIETYMQCDSFTYHESLLPSGLNVTPITRQVCVADGITLIEAKAPVTNANKETLASLLDYAAEIECTSVIACVKKTDPNFKSIVASFMSVGFSIVRSVSVQGYVLLGSEL